jgi:hypothetical protein
MRKLLLAAVAALVAALAIAGVASAINGEQGIQAKIAQSKAGTKAKPRSVGKLTVTTTTTPAAGEAGNFATKTAIVYFDKNIVFGGAKFPSCTQTQVSTDATKCAAGSLVGSGSSNAAFAGQPIVLTVKAYNGPGGNKLFLLVTNAQFNINTALIGTLKPATGNYGRKLTVTIPDNLQAPLGPGPGKFATLTEFVTKVGGTRKGTPYVGLKGCSGGKLKFKGVFNYTDGTSKTATTTAKCSKAS